MVSSSSGRADARDGYDYTLTKDDLKRRSSEDGLISNASEACFKGAAYDFRAGDEAIVARPQHDQHRHVLLEREEQISIGPGSAVTLRSHEEIDLPNDVKGRLSPKSALANKKVLYPGGLIDPGYTGYVWFTFFNLGTRDYVVKHGDQIVTGEFVAINPTEPYNDGERVEELRADMKPRIPSVDERYTFDWADINEQLFEIDENRSDIRELQKEVSRIDEITRYIVLAVVAGAVSGIIAGATLQILGSLI